MKKNLFFFLIAFFLVFFSLAKNAKAMAPNHFGCDWTWMAGCNKLGEVNCNPGYGPDVTLCEPILFSPTCLNKEIPCVFGAANAQINILKPQTCDCGGTCCLEWEHGICTHMGGIETALGCFPTSPKALVPWILKWALMFAGGIAFLLMLWGAFQIIMSSGDPEKIKKGQETLFSALAGLLMIIFAVFILRLLGVTILQIPGWT
ncbi:pilin [Patescibacteria group bacterium]